METQEIRHFPHKSVFTAQLITLLSSKQVGDIISDAEMMILINKDTRPSRSGYQFLLSAISYVLRNNGLVWKRLYKQDCIKCLNPSEISDLTDGERRRISKTASRSIRKLTSVNVDSLPAEQRQTYISKIAQFGMLKQFSSVKTLNALKSPEKSNKLLFTPDIDFYKKTFSNKIATS